MNDSTSIELFVSGRLCLFGEHSDWASNYDVHKGYCLVVGTDQGLTARAETSDRFRVETLVSDPLGRPTGRTKSMTCDWQGQTLLQAARDDTEFFRYCAGVAYEMHKRLGVGGIDLRIVSSDLPLKKGVSSSAAVCILMARAFNELYDLRLFHHELMELAYLGEIRTGSQCGRMDQACIYGKTPVLLTFEKDRDPRIEPVLTRGGIEMFIVDLAGRKDTVKILADLNAAYLRDDALQRALGEDNERIVRAAYGAIAAGDARRVGDLMSEAQSIFDAQVAPHSPEDLASPLLHEVLSLECLAEHVHGGKGVGSQGDGTAQFVARSAEDRDEAMRKIEEQFENMKCFPLSIDGTGAGHA